MINKFTPWLFIFNRNVHFYLLYKLSVLFLLLNTNHLHMGRQVKMCSSTWVDGFVKKMKNEVKNWATVAKICWLWLPIFKILFPTIPITQLVKALIFLTACPPFVLRGFLLKSTLQGFVVVCLFVCEASRRSSSLISWQSCSSRGGKQISPDCCYVRGSAQTWRWDTGSGSQRKWNKKMTQPYTWASLLSFLDVDMLMELCFFMKFADSFSKRQWITFAFRCFKQSV